MEFRYDTPGRQNTGLLGLMANEGELEDALCPRPIQYRFDISLVPLLLRVERELQRRATDNASDCWAYDRDLPDNVRLDGCIDFAEQFGRQEIDGTAYGFSWLRYRQSGLSRGPGYHLDANPGTGPGSETDFRNVPRLESWRLLINLHRSAERQFGYLDRDIGSLLWLEGQGSVRLADGERPQIGDEQVVTIPPRDGTWAHGLVFCASRVAHGGIETGSGHLLAGWNQLHTTEMEPGNGRL